MLNRIGFVPKGFRPQPDYYKLAFDAWCAVFLTDDEEYHLQLVLDPWEWQNGYAHAKGCEVLRQLPTCRIDVMGREFPSIKAGLCVVTGLLAKCGNVTNSRT